VSEPIKTGNLSPFQVDKLLRSRLTEAVIAQSRMRHAGLNEFLRKSLGGSDTLNGALFAEPVLEAATGYVSSGLCPADMDDLLHADLIHALTQCDDAEFRFNYPAYRHQADAWQKLRPEERNSLLVSSGTGSGKTECFLVPMLNDLARESAESGRLQGVRAIMLYPLNALIASQEKRLNQWTQRFDGRIRFALYNGLMKEIRERDADDKQAQSLNQVLYRSTLRKDPPPILVTNNTMLEYMTIRREDQGIVDASQGLLRWIVIDEAHSYIGSAAAELALLLRRVMQTFGVKAGDVRVVATSATIGSNSEEDKRTLQSFLADIAGVPSSQAFVITGEPQPVALESEVADSPSLEATELARSAVIQHPSTHAAVKALRQKPQRLSSLATVAEGAGLSADRFSEVLAGIGVQGGAIVPQRVHGFVRAVSGLWTCLNPACIGPRPDEWPFGAIQHSALPCCPHCTAPVFEIVSCKECSEIYLLARDTGDHMIPRHAVPDNDEFVAASAREGETSFFAEGDNSENEEPVANPQPERSYERLIALHKLPQGKWVHVDPVAGSISDTSEGLQLWCSPSASEQVCLNCAATPNRSGMGPLWPFRFGAPFLMQNVVPTLLEGVSPVEGQDIKLAFEGRRLISFTDSRQGTARLAANIETMGERSYVRSFIYHAVQKAGAVSPLTPEDIKEVNDLRVARDSASGAVRAALEASLNQKLAKSEGGTIPWESMIAALAEQPMLDQIAQVWDDDRERRYLDDRRALARFLLMREMARRPRLANSIETLGFARLIFPEIERLSDARLPDEFRRKGKSITDWHDFLYFMVDWLRGSFALRIEPEDAHWMPGTSFPRQVISPGDTKGRSTDLPWPRANLKGIQPNAVLALERGLALDLGEAEDRDIIQCVMQNAWDCLRPMLDTTGDTYALDLSKAQVANTKQAWLCPVTGKVINRLVFGISQNGFRSRHPAAAVRPSEINFPNLPDTFPRGTPEASKIIATFLNDDAEVLALRSLGLWNALHDSAARFAPYLRAEEHSAQQPPHRLRAFEEQFAEGRINLLACSTTMEMGVDIGSIEAVLNTNVPPSIANYKQRVGRAGRRGQSFSFSMTLARDTALDREAFSDPVHYLERQVRAPKVSLDSVRIVQRHCNALLLGIWLREADGQLTKLKAGPFFGCREDFKDGDEDSPSQAFEKWLLLPSTRVRFAKAIERLAVQTGLQGHTGIFDECATMFDIERHAFRTSWGRLADEAIAATGPGKVSAEIRARRMLREPLLKELANRSLLPGSGFPNSVIPFITDSDVRKPRAARSDREEQQTSRNQRYDYPSRNADIAIREYAPGADVVIDGLVWKSAGVTLNWQRHAADEERPQIQSLRYGWKCNACGEAGTSISHEAHCVGCGSSDLARDRFLEPAGFRVERSTKPHADTDNASYIEPIPPRISAKGAAWQPLLDAELGRMRSSPNGLVFHMSKGRKKEGYRLCLECGRVGEEGDNTLHEHPPLAYVKDKGSLCPGNDKTYAITDTIALGCETLTDVVELQPENLAHEGTAWAVASALREGLARYLGIEARELGLGVDARAGRLGSATHSIFLFDQASGGAGYVPRLLDSCESIVRDAAQILDCPDDCERGCSSCVLTTDLYAQQEKIDRRAALIWISALHMQLGNPAPEDLATPDSVLSARIGDALVARMASGDTIDLYFDQRFSVEAMHQPPLAHLFALGRQRGVPINVVLAGSLFSDLDNVERVALRNASHQHRFTLHTTPKREAPEGSLLVAVLARGTAIFGYFTRDVAAAEPGQGWGMGALHPVVCGQSFTKPPTSPITPEELELLPAASEGVLLIEKFPPAMMPRFGQTLLAQALKPKLEEIGAWHPGRLVSISYADRYLKSPLTLGLAMGCFAALRKALAPENSALPCTIVTRDLGQSDWRRSPYRIGDDWDNEKDRAGVAQGLADQSGLALEWQTGAAPHGRQIVLHYDNSPPCRIFLDQGFGYWQAERPVKFDFRQAPAQQTAALLREAITVRGNGNSYLAFKIDS
jgi:DEAD/DEAH box helicase domain-containing protein